MSDRIYGIDFGTTNSGISYVDDNGIPQIIEIDEKEYIKSTVTLLDDTYIVGDQSVLGSGEMSERTIKSIKRKIGEDTVSVGDQHNPVKIASYIFRELIESAEDKVDENIENVVISVPAYFSDRKRRRIKKSAELSGLNVNRIINEPTAAAMSYGLSKSDNLNVLVYDLGGGTFDVSILEITNGLYEIIATDGDEELGGDDWTKQIENDIINTIEDRIGNVPDTEYFRYILRSKAEEIKINLTSKKQDRIRLNKFVNIDSKIEYKISRSEFEKQTKDLRNRTINITKDCISEAELDKNDIDEVILVGGATRMPQIRDIISEQFKEPDTSVNPVTAVSLGCGIQGAIMSEDKYGGDIDDIVLMDVLPRSLGVKTKGGLYEPIIKKNTTIPTQETREFTTYSDGQETVKVHIYQGENEMAEENIYIDTVILENIPDMNAGDPNIRVTFSIGINGTLNVSVTSGNEDTYKEITVNRDDILSKNNDLITDSNNYDKKKRKKIKYKNLCETNINNIEKILNNQNLTDVQRKKLIDLNDDLENAVKSGELQEMESVLNNSEAIINEIISKNLPA